MNWIQLEEDGRWIGEENGGDERLRIKERRSWKCEMKNELCQKKVLNKIIPEGIVFILNNKNAHNLLIILGEVETLLRN